MGESRKKSDLEQKFAKNSPSWLNLRVFIPHNPSAILGIFKSLRNRNFALYFGGTVLSLVGAWMQQVAMGWLVYRLTNSIFMLSVSVFLGQIPILLITPFTGIVSDRFNRRKILMCTQSLMMAQALTLSALSYTNTINIPLIFTLCVFSGVVISFDAPARQSLYSTLVPSEDLSNAIALNSTAINTTRFIGPAIGGIVIAKFGETLCFFVNGVSFIFIIGALMLIKSNQQISVAKTQSAWRGIIEGFSYVWGNVPIRSIIILLMLFSFFGVPFPLLLPAFVRESMNGNAETLGNMMSFVGAGSLMSALYLAARKNIFGLGRVIIASSGMFGIALAIISHIKTPEIAYFMCLPIGFGMIATTASCNTMLQSLTSDKMRGRVMSIFTMSFFGMPPVGSLIQGWLSDIFSYETVVMCCGFICLATSLVFEIRRASIRKAARSIDAQSGKVPSEIAIALKASSNRHL